MEMHVAGGDQRNRAEGADLAQPVQPHLVGEDAQQVHTEPATTDELVQQPLGHRRKLRGFGHALG
jgi:hypothetical protein